VISSYTLDKNSRGAALDPPDGWIVNFSLGAPALVQPGGGYGRTQAIYKSGLLHIQGQNDPRPWLRIDTNEQVIPAADRFVCTNANIKYSGPLVVHSVPETATYTIDLSDTPV
jgi:hypothetical protein